MVPSEQNFQPLDTFVRHLLSEGILWDRGFDRPSLREIAFRLDTSFTVGIRNSLLRQRSVSLGALGELNVKETIVFSPGAHLLVDVMNKTVRLPEYLMKTWGVENTYHNAQFADWSILARVGGYIFNKLLDEDRNLNQLRHGLTEQSEKKVSEIFEALTLGLHDHFCLHRAVELETVGTFVARVAENNAAFFPDDYLWRCLYSQSSFELSTKNEKFSVTSYYREDDRKYVKQDNKANKNEVEHRASFFSFRRKKV